LLICLFLNKSLLLDEVDKIKAFLPLPFDEMPASEPSLTTARQISHRWEAMQYIIKTLLTVLQKKGRALYIDGELPDLSNTTSEVRILASCAFCKEEMVQRQTVFHGVHLSVLHNYLPFVAQNHFMIVSHRHAANHAELNEEGILEERCLFTFMGQRLENLFQDRGHKVWVQHGLLAGQTVPHHHTHIISNRTDDMLFWLCGVLCGLLRQKRTPITTSQYEEIGCWLTENNLKKNDP
jgi:diadenosine tetraphosphate (Ap4A) HIT family hydrolase